MPGTLAAHAALLALVSPYGLRMDGSRMAASSFACLSSGASPLATRSCRSACHTSTWSIHFDVLSMILGLWVLWHTSLHDAHSVHS
nr:hypothetical protein [Candidatus Sigynarchaeota archaeon]